MECRNPKDKGLTVKKGFIHLVYEFIVIDECSSR